jgi:hypothetical protein
MANQKPKIKIPWKERAYTDWNFGMYPTQFELIKRRCLLWQTLRFIILSWKFKKTASVNERLKSEKIE